MVNVLAVSLEQIHVITVHVQHVVVVGGQALVVQIVQGPGHDLLRAAVVVDVVYGMRTVVGTVLLATISHRRWWRIRNCNKVTL